MAALNVACYRITQDFWKVRKILAPKSVSIPHSRLDGMGIEITDPENIINQFQTEFLYSLDSVNEKNTEPRKIIFVRYGLKTAEK